MIDHIVGAALIIAAIAWIVVAATRHDRNLEERRRVRDLNKYRDAVLTARADRLVLDETTETVGWTKEPTA